MNFPTRTRCAPFFASAAGLLAAGLLLPAAVSAAPAASTGTLVGVVTCGADEATPAARIVVVAEGTNLQTHTDGAGRFMLSGVPAGQILTIDAVEVDVVASRFNVVAQPGQTLDIGSMDLAVCAQPATPPADDNPGPGDFSNDNGA